MTNPKKIPIYREDGEELLGFISPEPSSWAAQTIFGYTIARTELRDAAESVVRSQGTLVLKGIWRYQDADHEWYPCVLKEVYENRVVVVRTNELGYQDPEHYKLVSIKNPSENNLQKA